MSNPYGAPPPNQPAPPHAGSPRPDTPGQDDGTELSSVLPLVAAGAGLVAYVLGFFDQATSGLIVSTPGLAIVVAAGLAGLKVLPKMPDTLVAAGPLALYGTLAVLQSVLSGTAGGVGIVLLIMSLVQLAAVGALVLTGAGVVSSGPRPGRSPSSQPPYPQGPGSGPFPPSGAQPGQQPMPQGYGQPSGPQFAQPQPAQPPWGPPQGGQPFGGQGHVPAGYPSAPGQNAPGYGGPGASGQPFGAEAQSPSPSGGFSAAPGEGTQQVSPSGPQASQSGPQQPVDGPEGTRQMPYPGREN